MNWAFFPQLHSISGIWFPKALLSQFLIFLCCVLWIQNLIKMEISNNPNIVGAQLSVRWSCNIRILTVGKFEGSNRQNIFSILAAEWRPRPLFLFVVQTTNLLNYSFQNLLINPVSNQQIPVTTKNINIAYLASVLCPRMHCSCVSGS